MADWNADLYHRFNKERQQPVFDLIHRIPDRKWKRIIDIGCGSGMSTLPLRQRFTEGEMLGVDASKSMLWKARELSSDILWIKKDCSKPLNELGTFDLIFSNAALQWMQNQDLVIKNLSDILTDDGVMAMQVPYCKILPIEECVKQTAVSFPKEVLEGIEKEQVVCHSPEYYYLELSKHFSEVTLWQTNYFHIMERQEDIVSFYESTALRPYLNRLNKEEQKKFLSILLHNVKKYYPCSNNGKVLFEFARTFFIAEGKK